jgi:hypothetical protein
MVLGVCEIQYVDRSLGYLGVAFEVWRVSEQIKAWQRSESDISDIFNV